MADVSHAFAHVDTRCIAVVRVIEYDCRTNPVELLHCHRTSLRKNVNRIHCRQQSYSDLFFVKQRANACCRKVHQCLLNPTEMVTEAVVGAHKASSHALFGPDH